MTFQKAKLNPRTKYGFHPYLVGLKGPGRGLEVKQFKSSVPQDVISAVLDDLALTFSGKYHSPVEPISFLPSGRIFASNYGGTHSLHSYGSPNLQQMVLSPDLPITLEIQPSRKQREAYVMVKIVALKEAKALCKARYKAQWLEIELERKSVEQQGLREGDTFEWIPNEDGVLHGADVKSHPRREDAGETERTQRAFDELAEMVQQAGG